MSVVTPDDIRAIPERYAIGKRPLSLLLGWGELTYTRLLDGNTPTPAHAAELRRLLDDPAAYARVLETGRGRITGTAYARSFRAVDRILSSEGGAMRATRIFAVADRLCGLAEGDLTPGALQRLVYYAQGMCFAQLGTALFDDLPRAAVSGPVYDRISEGYTFDEIQRAGDFTQRESDEAEGGRDGRPEVDEHGVGVTIGDVEIEVVAYGALTAGDEMLSAAEKDVIDEAYRRYGDMSGQALARASRKESPWKKARKRAEVAEGEDCSERITAKSMTKFFSKN